MIQFRSEGIMLDVKPNQDIAITYSNPFFESDRVPVTVTTSVEFVITPQTRRIFKFSPSMLMKPQRRNIPAELLIGGLVVCVGTLRYDEYSDSSLKYTFSGAEFEDCVSGNLSTLPLRKFEGILLQDLVTNARNGLYPEFGVPMIIRKTDVAKFEYKTDTNSNNYSEVSVMQKYANWLYTDRPFLVPAVSVIYLLKTILPNLVIASPEVSEIISATAILGLHKGKDQRNDWGVKPTNANVSPSNKYCLINLDLADSLPNMSISDFILNILKMTCCTLYCTGRSYTIRANKDILSAGCNDDWTHKIADVYSCSAEKPKRYTLSFANESDSYAETASDPNEQSESRIAYECASMDAVIAKIKESADYINVRYTPSGDVYSGKNIGAILYYEMIFGVYGVTWKSTKTNIATLDIVHQSGFAEATAVEDPDTDNEDCSVDFEIPRCVPVEVFSKCLVGSTAVGLRCIAPIVDIPASGSDRDSKIYIGLLLANNFTDKGNFYTDQIPNSTPGIERTANITLAIDGDNGLYAQFHKHYADWLARDRDPRSVDLNLTAGDIANLKLWSKYMIHNQPWMIKSLEVTGNTSSDILTTTADLVEA